MLLTCELVFSSVFNVYELSPFDIPHGTDERFQRIAAMMVLFLAEVFAGRVAYRMNLLRFRNLALHKPASDRGEGFDGVSIVAHESTHEGSKKISTGRTSIISRTMTTRNLTEADREQLSSTDIRWTAGLFFKFIFFGNPDENTPEAIAFRKHFFKLLSDHFRKIGMGNSFF